MRATKAKAVWQSSDVLPFASIDNSANHGEGNPIFRRESNLGFFSEVMSPPDSHYDVIVQLCRGVLYANATCTTAFIVPVMGIVHRSAKEKMFRARTGLDITTMADTKSGQNGAVFDFPCETVSEYWPTMKAELPVARTEQSTGPQPAISRPVYFGPEAIDFFRGILLMHLTPFRCVVPRPRLLPQCGDLPLPNYSMGMP